MSTLSIRSPRPWWSAAWRSVLYLVTFLLATLALALPVGLGYFAFRALQGYELEEITLHLEDALLYLNTLLGAGQFLAALALAGIWMRWLDQRGRLAELGLGWPGRSPLMAFLLGVAMALLAVGLAAAMGKFAVTGWAWQKESLADVLLVDLAGLAPLLLFMVLTDELIFRGYIRWTFTRTASTGGIAPIASAVLYGLYRVVAWRLLGDTGVQDARTLVMVGLGGVAAGLALAWAWRVSKSLWTPAGLHLGWAWMSGLIFSLPVGGKTAEGLLLVHTAGGLLAGGVAGLEAGLIGMLVWLAAWGLLCILEQRTPGK
jgi:membrane protease YdiL (CAAX protease family)